MKPGMRCGLDAGLRLRPIRPAELRNYRDALTEYHHGDADPSPLTSLREKQTRTSMDSRVRGNDVASAKTVIPAKPVFAGAELR